MVIISFDLPPKHVPHLNFVWPVGYAPTVEVQCLGNAIHRGVERVVDKLVDHSPNSP